MKVNNPLSIAILTIVLILALNGCYWPVQGPVGIPLTEDDIENINNIEGASYVFYLFGIFPFGDASIIDAIKDARMELSDQEKLEFTLMTIEYGIEFALIGYVRCIRVRGLAHSR